VSRELLPDRDRAAFVEGVSVILPAYNEEEGVGAEVAAVRRVLVSHRIPHEIIVVDDGSVDDTAGEAVRAGARVLRHVENRGYGASIKDGIMAAVHETIVITDADGTYPADEIPALLARLQAADMVVGARTGPRVAIPRIRRPAKWILGWLANRIAGRRIEDLNSGLRAFRRECVRQYFVILSNRFSFTTTVTLAYLADDYHVVYHPISYHPRVGQSKIAPRNFMDFVILVLRMAMLFHPLRVFLPLALAVGSAGVLKVVYDIVAFVPRSSVVGWSFLYQAVLSSSAVFLLLAALQLLLIGMVADGILRRMAQHNRALVPSRALWFSEAAPRAPTEEPVVARVAR
jgi:glycosyltransferase involved in cell wall biosynthesis